ncbi:MAG: ABC transporter ATPase [Atopobiaceae bacterium]
MCVWTRSLIICDAVLAVVINTSATLLGGAELVPALWFMQTCTAFGTNVLVQLALPVPAVGASLASPFKGWAGSWIVAVFAENLCYVTIISFAMALTQAGFSEALVPLWLSTYLWLVLIGYATSLALVGIQRTRES